MFTITIFTVTIFRSFYSYYFYGYYFYKDALPLLVGSNCAAIFVIQLCSNVCSKNALPLLLESNCAVLFVTEKKIINTFTGIKVGDLYC